MPHIKSAPLGSLRIAGTKMSNWLYNMAQSKDIPDHLRPQMKEMVREWDSALKEFLTSYLN